MINDDRILKDIIQAENNQQSQQIVSYRNSATSLYSSVSSVTYPGNRECEFSLTENELLSCEGCSSLMKISHLP